MPPEPESDASLEAAADADAPAPAATHDALQALEKYFGHRRFLDGQARIISAILAGQDALGIMPTGGGKSLCFQLPALVMDGVTIVISPLIALMKDQVDGLVRRGIPATMINSQVPAGEQRQRIDGMRRGEWKLVYVAPERFGQRAFIEALRSVPIALFAIDEAHCISQWGHDFRPDYMRLGRTLQELGRPQTVAFTATATPVVRQDIMAQLQLRDPFLCVSGFARPNLSLNITHCAKKTDKLDRLREVVRTYKTGVVYCATRTKVEETFALLQEWRIPCISYHGGMNEQERTRAQELFISRDRDVVVATNAFGMGIDRPDVRFVVHMEIPGSVEAYYQEAGRAGRDGEPGWCELLFNFADKRTQEFFIEGNNPGFPVIRDVYGAIRQRCDDRHETLTTIEQIAIDADCKNSMAVSSAISTLVRAGVIERYDVPGQRVRGTRLLKPELAPARIEIDRKSLEEKERRDRSKLAVMLDFAYSTACRQRFILEYFDEKGAVDCGQCDFCRARASSSGMRQGTEEEMLAVRKALSGVARCCTRRGDTWEGKFGRGRIIGMLTGSRSKDVISAHLDELTTYGILKEKGSSWVQTLFRSLESAGLLETVNKGGDRGESIPVISLTARGEQIMKRGGPLMLAWPDSALTSGLKPEPKKSAASSKIPEAEIDEIGFDETLYEKLRAVRTALAKAEGVPAYCIFPNQTLEFFTRLRPQNQEAALRIRGVSESKSTRYVEPFLEAIRKHGG